MSKVPLWHSPVLSSPWPRLLGMSAAIPLWIAATPSGPPLQPLPASQVVTTECPQACLGLDQKLWGTTGQPKDKSALLLAIDYSLQYLKTDAARTTYAKSPVKGVTLTRVDRSLRRFRQLLLQAKSPQALQRSVQQEFTFYQSVGKDNQGTVGFTGYYQPIHSASRTRTKTYRYPLYKRPPDFEKWSEPHPTRLQLEGKDGLQASQGKLKGLELFWLRDRLEAFLVQVQGSALLRFPDGSVTGVGFNGRTKYPYTSIGKELIKDGKLEAEGITLQKVVDYLNRNPQELNNYLPRNQSFVFFSNTGNAPPQGSLKVPVTTERSIATDKSLMPPGAIALIQTELPLAADTKAPNYQRVNRFVLDQDTGSAIKGPGRVDIFMGTGDKAGQRAGLVNHPGKLYYLLLNE
jgi:membrane-bound lytic murein transglycosylase A